MVILKLLFKELNITIIEMLSQISRFDIIAAYSYFIKNCTFAKIFMIGCMKLYDLLIHG